MIILSGFATSGETLGATWDEFDLDLAIWSIPARRTKAAREHRVPLPARAIEILHLLDAHRNSGLVFPGQNPLKQMARAPPGKVVIGYQLDVCTTTPAGRRSALRKELQNLKQDPHIAFWLHRMTEAMMIAWRPTDESDKVRMFETALTAGEYPFAKAVLEPVFDWNLARREIWKDLELAVFDPPELAVFDPPSPTKI